MTITIWGALCTIAALGLVVSIQSWRFERGVAAAAKGLFRLRGEGEPRVSNVGLPEPVRRFAEAVGATRHAPIKSLRLVHGGTFRPSFFKPPFPIRGMQYFSADVPGFVWWGRIRMAPGVWTEARDTCIGGVGNMLIRVESIITLDDARGPEMDSGSLLRLLGEMNWYPTSLLDGRYVEWSSIDDTSARATLRVGGHEVQGVFHFGQDNLLRRMEALRPFGAEGVPTPWYGEYSDYREVEGLKVPFQARVSWVLDGTPFEYAHWEMERVEFDRPEPF